MVAVAMSGPAMSRLYWARSAERASGVAPTIPPMLPKNGKELHTVPCGPLLEEQGQCTANLVALVECDQIFRLPACDILKKIAI